MTWRTMLLTVLTLILVVSSYAATTKEKGVPAAQALSQLKEGAERFATGKSTFPHQDAERFKEIAGSQHPFATILSCSDSRVPVEMIMDEGFGDLFVVRVAGNVAGPEQIASIEYAIEHLGTNVVVVLGHSKCGAVTAAANGATGEGAMETLLKDLKPSVDRAREKKPAARPADLVPTAVTENVWVTVEKLLSGSALIRERVTNGTLKLVGAVYHLEDTRTEWLGRHPRDKELAAMNPDSPDNQPALAAPAAEQETKKVAEVVAEAVENKPIEKPEAQPAVVKTVEPVVEATPAPVQGTERIAPVEPAVNAQKSEQADLQAQIESLRKQVAQLQEMIMATKSGSDKTSPKLVSTDDQFAVADNAALEQLSAQVAGLKADLDKAKKTPVQNAPSVSQGAITLTGFIHQQYYNKFGVKKVSSFETKRVRMGVTGTVNSWAKIEIVGDFAKSVKLVDGNLALIPGKAWLLRFGQFRPPSGMEITKSTLAIPFINYTSVYSLNSDRDVGAAVTYSRNLSKKTSISLATGLFNGSGMNVSDSNTFKNSTMRAELRFMDHFMVGANSLFGKNNASVSPKNIDTYGATANWSTKAQIVEAEYVHSKVGGVKKAAWYVWGGQTFKTGLKFCSEIQAVARYEQTDDNLATPSNGTNRITLGTNLFVDKKYTLIQLNYQINGEQGTSISNNELLMNVQVSF
jgi:carbonic anhydrase